MTNGKAYYKMKGKIGWGISFALVAALIVVGIVIVRLALREEPVLETAGMAEEPSEETDGVTEENAQQVDQEALALLSGDGGDLEVLVLGIEGVDWDFLEPLLDEGLLPNLQSIVDRAATGRLVSGQGDRHPNITWTNIATGKKPEKHRLGQPVELPRGGVATVSPLLGSFGRAGKAIWNILSTAGVKVGLVGWPGTFPAEPVRGFAVVSYEKYYLQFTHQDELDELNFPPFLLDETSAFIYPEQNFTPEDFSRFLNVEPGEESVLQGMYLISMTRAYNTDRMVANLWLHMAEKYEPRAGFVWLGGTDLARSSFYQMINLDADEFKSQAPESWANIQPMHDALNDVDVDFMMFTDEMLGLILETVSEDTKIILISEHGYKHIDVGPGWVPESKEEIYTESGIFAVAGAGVKAGEKLGELEPYDVVPTVLALFGLPTAEDMDGEPITDSFDPGIISTFPSEEISTYETPGYKPERTKLTRAIDSDLEERLRSMGYIE
jgi:hypothetical protein